MSKPYTPHNWFWLSDDGRVFGSAAGKVADAQDAAYKAWISDGSVATPWPKDDDGKQTDAALDDVLSPYGLSTGGALATIPVSVTNFQAHAALLSAGLETKAQDAITAITDPAQQKLAQLAFDKGAFYRNSPLVAQLASALSLTAKRVDDLFIAASKIAA